MKGQSRLSPAALAVCGFFLVPLDALSAPIDWNSTEGRTLRLGRAADIALQGRGKDGFIDRDMKSTLLKALSAAEKACPRLRAVHLTQYPRHALDTLDVTLTPRAWAQLRVMWTPEGPRGIVAVSTASTGIAGLDELNSRFALKEMARGVGTRLRLTFSRTLDMPVVAGLYSALSEVSEAAPEGIAGKGSSLDVVTGETDWALKYSYGWGDCEAGCIHHYYYELGYDPASDKAALRKERPADGSEEAAREVKAACRPSP